MTLDELLQFVRFWEQIVDSFRAQNSFNAFVGRGQNSSRKIFKNKKNFYKKNKKNQIIDKTWLEIKIKLDFGLFFKQLIA